MTTAAGTTELLGVCATAAVLGCHASTISRYLKDFPDLNQGSKGRPKVDVDALRRHRAENLNAARSGSYAGRLLGERNGLDADDGCARPTPSQADAPSYPAARAAREVVLAEKAGVPESDLEFWRAQRDPSAPEAMVNHPELFWCEGHFVTVGRCPT